MKKPIFVMMAASLGLFLAGVGYADTLTGKVTEMNSDGNSLTIAGVDGATGQTKEYKLVWEDGLQDQKTLETAHIGDSLTVDAGQNAITRNWTVTTARGPMSAVDNALHTGERLLSGEIRSIDTAGNTIVLASKDKDAAGQPTEYRIVWDDSNANVREKLEDKKVGNNISVRAEQNMVTKNWKATSIAGALDAIGEGDVRTLNGEVKEVNPEKNFIVLNTTDESGRAVERKIVWDSDFHEQAKLDGARVGQHLSVRADQNFVTRNWKVKALG